MPRSAGSASTRPRRPRWRSRWHEVFEFVATARAGTAFHVTVTDRRHRAEAEVRCDLPRAELHWLSAVRPIDLDDEDALRALGLMLSSRLVDRFSVGFDPVGAVVLRLSKDRAYPSASGDAAPRPAGPDTPVRGTRARTRLGRADAAAGEPVSRGCTGPVPLPFRGEGRAADMRAAGDLDAAVVTDPGGGVVGGIAWVRTSPRLVTVFGPVMAAGREHLAAAVDPPSAATAGPHRHARGRRRADRARLSGGPVRAPRDARRPRAVLPRPRGGPRRLLLGRRGDASAAGRRARTDVAPARRARRGHRPRAGARRTASSAPRSIASTKQVTLRPADRRP